MTLNFLVDNFVIWKLFSKRNSRRTY